jgi:carboxylesterase
VLRPVGVEPFYFERGPVGCLLVHGFGGSPAEMRGLGGYLAERDVTALGVLLTGHDGTPEEFGRVRWQDWVASVDKGLAQLRARCTVVFVAGLSLGGLLTLDAATRGQLDGVVVMSAPITLGGLDAMLVLMPVIRRVMPWWYPLRDANFDDPALRAELARRVPAGQLNLDDPQAVDWLRHNARVSTRAIDQFGQFMRRVRRELPTVRVPLLVMQGCRDEWVPSECPSEIFARVSSRDKELLWFEQSGHQLVDGPERETVWQVVYRFIARRSSD